MSQKFEDAVPSFSLNSGVLKFFLYFFPDQVAIEENDVLLQRISRFSVLSVVVEVFRSSHIGWVLCLEHKCSELRCPVGEFFLWCALKCLSLSVLITFSWKTILLDIRKATSTCFLGPLVERYFPSLMYWDNDYIRC